MSSIFRKGIYLALATALFSGVANFVNKFALTAVGDPLVHTTLKNSIVAILIISLLVLSKKLPQLRKLSKRDFTKLFAIGVIGGSLPFYLFFTGLSQMPAINAALIHKSLIFWVAIMAIPILKEKITSRQLAALGLIFGANLMVGGFKGFNFSAPELMVLLATVLWAAENIIAKITLKNVDPDIVVSARMGLGSLILLTAVGLTDKTPLLMSLDFGQVSLVALTSLILFGYVSTWYRALKVAPVTLVATVLTLATLVTNSLSAIFVTHAFTFSDFAQFVLMLAGSWFFLISAQRATNVKEFSKLAP